MNVIDIHAHIYERVAGITRGQPMASTDLEMRKCSFFLRPLNRAAAQQKCSSPIWTGAVSKRRFLCLIPITGTITGTLRTA